MKKIIYGIIAVVILIAIGYAVVNRMSKKSMNVTPPPVINSFDDCVRAGYPVMESYPRKCITPDRKTFIEEVQNNSPEIIPGIKSLLYENKEFGFQVWYPDGSQAKDGNFEGFLSVTGGGVPAVGIYLSPSLFTGTNLSEAAVAIGVSSDNIALQNCDRAADAEEKSLGTSYSGKILFSVFEATGVGAGNIYESKIYRTIYNGSCYEIVEMLHSGNIGNYPEGTVKEFDKPRFSGILENIFKTFVFTRNTASGVMGSVNIGPTCPVEKNPPDPNCAPKPYQTSISINKDSFSKTIESDSGGRFRVDLDPGSYEFKAGGEAVLPRCSPVMAEVQKNRFSYLSISCDSGIR